MTDLLHELFGYDKYTEITSEHSIRGTFCDLAIRIEGGLQFLIEVKAIGAELKDSFVKQAIDYAANQGTDWVALTNGITWRVYKVAFTKPISHELVVELNVADLSHRNGEHVELLWMLAKEGWQKSGLGEYHTQRQALSRFSVGALVLSDPVLDLIRRELRRISPGVKIDTDEIKNVLLNEVLKREVVEGEKADEARRQVARASNRSLRARTPREGIPIEAAGSGEMPVPKEPTPIVEG
ncbi:MAG: restriction endonuclease subunit R [Kofleriaceae bacterium]